ncbi:MAG TPA: hypothetical protein VMX75_13655 [Spirochaetia bacterium]|nr:hypothetical protein [Spirochaetia bacterium]
MNPEDKSKIQSFLSDLEGLKSRNPEESKFKDCKEKIEKKLEDVFGKGSEQLSRFGRVKFFNFSKGGRNKDVPLSETERHEYIAGLDEAKQLLQRYI